MTWRISRLVALVILLGGCLSDQKKESARCSVEGRRAYPASDHAGLNDRGQFVMLCMNSAGYEFSFSDQLCAPGLFVAENPYCYQPFGAVARQILEVELSIERL